jgi:tetratricopeptide (TPR) repeat protein
MKDYGRALPDLDKAIELNSKNAEAHYYRGLCYQALGQDDKALADFQAAISNTTDPLLLKSAMDQVKALR